MLAHPRFGASISEFNAMYKLAGLAALAALSAVALPASAQVRCPTATAAEIDAQFAKFNAAWATGNPDTVTSLFTQAPVLLATVSNRPRTDGAAVRDYFVSFLKNKPVGVINSSTTEIDCNTASRVGTWTVTLTNPQTGAKSDVKARYSFIYRWEAGAWKIDHLHSSAMPEPTA
jgi:uncharacterized protein (TIGR02246 family)